MRIRLTSLGVGSYLCLSQALGAFELPLDARKSRKHKEVRYCPTAMCLDCTGETLCRFIEYIAESAADKRLSILSPFWG